MNLATETLVLTGSQAAAACGVDPFRSPVALWSEMLGLAPNWPDSEAAYWGNVLQSIVAEEVERRGYAVMPAPADAVTNPLFPWLEGHPDGYCGRDPRIGDGYETGRGVLEIKTTSPYRRGEWDDDQVPAHVLVQATVYMLLTGLRWSLAACLVGGQKLELREFEYDADIAEIILTKTQEFLGYVVRQEPPPPDGAKSTSDVLARLYPTGTGEVIELTPDLYQLAVRREKLREQVKEIERQQNECDQGLRIALGEASAGMWEGRKVVTLSDVNRKGYEVEAKSYRQLRVRP